MATRGMFSTTDLLAPLAQRGISLSSSQVYRLVVDRPERGGRRRRPGQTTQAPMPWRSGPRSSPTADPQRLESLGSAHRAGKAGATTISPPVCTECSKPLRTLQRRGEDWYCGVCGPIRRPCASCGDLKKVHSRDRDGRPRCIRCALDDGRDPVEIVGEVIAVVDPALPAGVVTAATNAAAAQTGQRRQMAWALQERPELLTGAGAQATVPSVLRLIDKLCEAGATNIVRPPCPHCGRVIPLVKPRGGVRLCRNCVAKSRAEPCAGCGRVCEAATRDEHGQPLCPNCLVSDPANLEVYLSCDRRRIVGTRTPDGPLCPGCPPLPILVCSICGMSRPCGTARLTGLPWCPPCQRRSGTCARCGQVKPIRSGTLDEPYCQSCTVSAFPDCPVCATAPHPGQCPDCCLELRLRELISGPTAPPIPPCTR
ncbi:MAG: hypothetical protein ACRDQI_04970 [Pseudonocardiaceae bacterium]